MPSHTAESSTLPRRRRRWPKWVVGIVLSAALGLYAGSYQNLARRGRDEARAKDFPTFFYVPLAELQPGSDALERHHWRAAFYGPANAIDQMFGRKLPPTGRVRGVSWSLAGPANN